MTEDTRLPSDNKQQTLTSENTDNPEYKPLFAKLGTGFFTVATLITFFITMIVTLFIAIPMVMFLFPTHFGDIRDTEMLMSMLGNGTVLSVSIVLNLMAFSFYCWLILKIRHKKFHQYLAFKPFTLKTMFICIGLWILYVIATEVLFYLTDHQPMDFMDAYYNSAESLWLLILGIVVIAPIYEELLFRGLIWRAIAEQFGKSEKRGAVVASVVTGLLFSGVHLQYDILEMGTIFTLALILGFARYRSGSLWLPILLHMINNGVSMGMYIYAQ